MGSDGIAARVVADAREQLGGMAEAAQRHGHVHGGSAGMLTTRAVGVDDDVGEGFSGDEECRGHRSIIAGFAVPGERDGGASRARALRCGGRALRGCGAVDAVERLTLSDLAGANRDNGPHARCP